MRRTSELPFQKIKSQINHSSLTSEEIDALNVDDIANKKCAQQVRSTSKKLHSCADSQWFQYFKAQWKINKMMSTRGEAIERKIMGKIQWFYWKLFFCLLRVIYQVIFSVFCSIIMLSMKDRIREFSMVRISTFSCGLPLFVKGSYYFLLCWIFSYRIYV